MKLDATETAFCLAGLRLLKWLEPDTIPREVRDMLDEGNAQLLDNNQISDLCEKINLDRDQPEPQMRLFLESDHGGRKYFEIDDDDPKGQFTRLSEQAFALYRIDGQPRRVGGEIG